MLLRLNYETTISNKTISSKCTCTFMGTHSINISTLLRFESVLFFHDIPKDGSVGIFKGEVPDPNEWLEENNALLLQKAANKKKNPQDVRNLK